MKVDIQKDGVTVKLLEPIYFTLEGKQYEIPVGFETDFASTPRALWFWIPPWGLYNKAAVIHDYINRNRLASFSVSDSMFLDTMVESGVGEIKRNVMWAGLRLHYWLVRSPRDALRKLRGK